MSDLTGPALLRECLDRLDWAPERFAREICKTAARPVVSAKAPYHWLNGAAPRGAVPELAALTLSRALGEHVTVSCLWPGARAQAVALSAHSGLDLPWTAAGAWRCAGLICRPTGRVLLPATGTAAVAPVIDWFTAAGGPLPERAGGEEVSPQALDVLRERVGQLRRLDDTRGGPMVLEWVKQDLRWAASLACTAAYDQRAGAALFRVLAELAQLAGWSATDLGQHALGQRYLIAALRFAAAAHDTELAAAIVSCLAYLALWMNAPQDAARMIRMARSQAAAQASPVTAALLAAREARAHASVGAADACARAIDEAAAHFGSRAAARAPVPSWAYWVTEAVLVADAGRSWLEAGRPEQAIPRLRQGLALFGESQPRNRLLHHVSLAQSMLLTREVDGAVQAADEALALTAAHDSDRARIRLRELRASLAASSGTQAIAAADRISDLISA
jgi:hypothetical protein